MLLFGKKLASRNPTQHKAVSEINITIYRANKHEDFVYLIKWFHDNVEFTTVFDA